MRIRASPCLRFFDGEMAGNPHGIGKGGSLGEIS
jgi:hypothetical protein